jgi:hypothetical protein
MFHLELAVEPGVPALPLGWPAIKTLARGWAFGNALAYRIRRINEEARLEFEAGFFLGQKRVTEQT